VVMKVRCKANKLRDIKDEAILHHLCKHIHLDDDIELCLSIGIIYNVYGIVFWGGCPWYYICEEDSDIYPKPNAAEFFEVVDDRLSAYWVLEHRRDTRGNCHSSIVFREWAKNNMFYENLVDECPAEVEIFQKYRKLIDNEFLP
jgi:hypothetical protein